MKGYTRLIIIGIAMACMAAVYVQTDKSGNIEYTDVPSGDNAKQVDLPQVNTAPGPAAAGENPASGSITVEKEAPAVPAAPAKAYSVFDLASPADGETIQNQPVIPIDIKIDPPLRPNDKIQIYLDGTPWGPPGKSTHFEFNAPDRGTHTLSAKLLDVNNNVVMQSGVNTVYIHHAHLGGQ